MVEGGSDKIESNNSSYVSSIINKKQLKGRKDGLIKKVTFYL